MKLPFSIFVSSVLTIRYHEENGDREALPERSVGRGVGGWDRLIANRPLRCAPGISASLRLTAFPHPIASGGFTPSGIGDV